MNLNSKARTSLTGTTFYSPAESHAGLTLYAPVSGKEVCLVDMKGKIIHKWQLPGNPAGQPELLANGHLLVSCKTDRCALPDLEGGADKILEMDKAGRILWEYDDPYMHHSCKRLDNGNTLILKWVEVPGSIAEKVQGGLEGFGKDRKMYGDALQEISAEEELVWEWNAHDYLDPQADSICPICSRDEWTHVTSVDILSNGNILLNCMRTNTIVVVNRINSLIEYRWGKQELSHPNGATVLKNGHFLVFDCGRHCEGEGQGFSRALEVDPATGSVVWGYEEDPPVFLYSCFLGSAQRLPNDNTLICEGTTGRFLEVNKKGSMGWEYVNPDYNDSPVWGRNRYVHGARRYGLDYAGLRAFYGLDREWKMWDELPSSRPDGVCDAGAAAQQAPAEPQSMEDLVRSRLEPLGY